MSFKFFEIWKSRRRFFRALWDQRHNIIIYTIYETFVRNLGASKHQMVRSQVSLCPLHPPSSFSRVGSPGPPLFSQAGGAWGPVIPEVLHCLAAPWVSETYFLPLHCLGDHWVGYSVRRVHVWMFLRGVMCWWNLAEWKVRGGVAVDIF